MRNELTWVMPGYLPTTQLRLKDREMVLTKLTIQANDELLSSAWLFLFHGRKKITRLFTKSLAVEYFINIVHFWVVLSFAGVAAEKVGFQLEEVVKSMFLLARSYKTAQTTKCRSHTTPPTILMQTTYAPGCIPSSPVHVSCWFCLFDEFEKQRRAPTWVREDPSDFPVDANILIRNQSHIRPWGWQSHNTTPPSLNSGITILARFCADVWPKPQTSPTLAFSMRPGS